MRKTIALPEYKRLCTLLMEARQAAGLLQAQLAKKLRKPQSFVSKVETAQRPLDIFEFLTYTRTLNLDPYQVLQQIEQDSLHKDKRRISDRKKA